MASQKILVVEDEKDIAELISFNLEKEGFKVVKVFSGEDGIQRAGSDVPDLILLDIMLPGMNGLDVCREVRRNDKTSHIPIIMLTAKDEDTDIITGLEIGANDYVTKPFSPKVLIARIRALLRRAVDKESPGTAPIKFGEMIIDRGRHQVKISGRDIQLTMTEFQLLLIFARKPGWVYSRAQLIDDLREGHYVITDRAIDVQIANLRKKLGPYGDYIETVRGIGYKMKESP